MNGLMNFNQALLMIFFTPEGLFANDATNPKKHGFEFPNQYKEVIDEKQVFGKELFFP